MLCEFRQRLVAHNGEARVFEQVLMHLKAIGLIKRRGIQRTTNVVMSVALKDRNPELVVLFVVQRQEFK